MTPFAPVIATQPLSQIIHVGSNVSFTASASGYPLPTVQWNVSTNGGQTWSPISGATSPTYSFTVTSVALDGTEYQAVFTNSQGSTPTNPATLTAIAAPFAAWNFDTSDKTGAAIPIATNTSPDPSTGSGTAGSIGMALVTGPDASNITAVNGSSDTSSANQVWKIVGTNGWSSTAPIGSQGAQFLTSTVGYSNLSVQFDLETTAQGEGNLAVEYTTNGGSTWSLAPSLNANGDAGITVATNTTSAITVQGEYFNVTGGDLWYNRLTADFNGVAGVANNPGFGIRLVNASTGADCVNSTGQPLGNTSGNWRFDEMDIDGTALPFPLVTTQPISQVGTVGKLVSFTAAASGTPTPTVQWEISTNGGSTWSPIAGATSATYSFTVSSTSLDGYEYQAVFTNSLGSTSSNPATLTAVAAPFTAWNFDTSDVTGKAIPAATNTAPDPSAGSGTATSIGMALVSGPDASAVLADSGSSDASSTNQAWKIAGTNGWSSTAPIGSQGAQFLGSTVGYSNISVQFDLNLTAQGEGKIAVEYTTNGGATWSDATSLSTNGDAGITVATNTTSANTIQGEYFDATGGGIWYNRLTADFIGVPGVANNPNFGIRLVNASTGADCVNSTGAALNNTSGNWRFDEVDINGVAAPPPMVVSVTPEDDAGNGVAAGSAAKGQRSMETQIAVVFSEPVNLASGAFTIGLANQYGSGANNGSADTLLSGVLGTPTNPSGDGMTWIIPILSNGTNSYGLKGTNGGISGASLDNGVYRLNVVAAEVTGATGGIAMTANYSSAYWHRLYGDVDNAQRVFNTEYSAFLAAFTSTAVSNGATNYNQDLDYDGDGRVFNTDYAAFLADFGSIKIYGEPQS
jgi:hypothetical protein